MEFKKVTIKNFSLDEVLKTSKETSPILMEELQRTAKKYNCTIITNEMAKAALNAIETITKIRREVTEVPERAVYTDGNGYLIGSLVLRSDILRIIDNNLANKKAESEEV